MIDPRLTLNILKMGGYRSGLNTELKYGPKLMPHVNHISLSPNTLCDGVFCKKHFCMHLKGNTMAIFNKNMLESMSIQIFPTYCFCCTILLIIKIN